MRAVRTATTAAAVALLAVPFVAGAASTPDEAAAGEVCRVADEDVVEASGLVATGSPPQGTLVTVNDSGDEGRVFVLDAGSCATVGVTRWEEDPDDVEALAPGADGRGVWVGDIGDNPGNREEIRIALLPVAAGDREAAPQWTELRYPDGARDAEALLRHPRTGRLLVVSKRVVGGAVYAVPDRVAPGAVGELRRVGDAPSLVTDGAFWPDGRHLVLRNYTSASVHSWPGLDRVASFGLPAQPQGEALAVTPDGRVLVTSEGQGEPVLEVDVPEDVRAVLDGGPSPSAPRSGSGSGTGSGARPGADQGIVPGEAAGPAVSDGDEDGVAWRGVVAAAIGLVGAMLFAGFLSRRPGAGRPGGPPEERQAPPERATLRPVDREEEP